MKIEAIIRKTISKAIRMRDPKYLEKELNKLFRKNNIPSLLSKELKKEAFARYEWLESMTIKPEERKVIGREFKKAASDFAIIKGRLHRDLLNRVSKAISEDMPFRTIINITESIIGKFRFQARTITETALGAFDTTAVLIEAEKAGIDKFKYFGPPAERPFCSHLLAESKAGKTWTRAEIESMDNGQGLPVLYYRGGYNCRHSWVIAAPFIEKTPKRKLRPEEIITAKILYENGNRIKILPEPGKDNQKQYDALVNGVPTEFKTITEKTKTEWRRVRDNITGGIKQGAEHIVLNIEKKEFIISDLIDGIILANKWDNNHYNKIKIITVIINNKIIKISKKDMENEENIKRKFIEI